MSKSHISIALCETGKARTYFQFLPGEETVTTTRMQYISVIKAISKFTAFQLQSAKSAPYVITQSSYR